MKVSAYQLQAACEPMARLLLVVIATYSIGCVSLNKPKVVEECDTTHTCTNDPKQQQGPDANGDTQLPSPDLQPGDTPTAKADLGPDSFVPDAPSDQVSQGPDTKDTSTTDSREVGPSTDADSGLPLTDSGPEVDRQDLGPDLGRDLGPDLAADIAPDLRPDAGPDTGPDLGPDTSPDTSTLGNGLVVYYKCESATGTTLPDSSGNGNDGTLSGGTAGYTFPAGKVGKALSLIKAGSGYATIPSKVFANATNITIATWIYVTTAQNWARVFDVGVNAKLANNTATGTHYMNFVPKNDGTNLAFAISKDGYGSEQILSSTALATGTWKHVAVVLGPGQGSLYVDGALVLNSTTVLLRPADLGTIDYAYLGKSQFTNDSYFDGQIDEFRVYSRALSAAEIKELYQFAGQ